MIFIAYYLIKDNIYCNSRFSKHPKTRRNFAVSNLWSILLDIELIIWQIEFSCKMLSVSTFNPIKNYIAFAPVNKIISDGAILQFNNQQNTAGFITKAFRYKQHF